MSFRRRLEEKLSKLTATHLTVAGAVVVALLALASGASGVIESHSGPERLVRDGRGDPGASGVRGPRGAPGATVSGPRGVSGKRGRQGPVPELEPVDDLGTRGPPGRTGADGEQGRPGEEGVKGATGQRGTVGARGADGPQGAEGARGAAGLTGLQGDSGEGPQGETGATGAQGPAGPQGPEGLQGPQGATGATGAQGPKGDPGPRGPQGDAGPQGPKGETGVTGDTGPQGPTGPEGPAGGFGNGREVLREGPIGTISISRSSATTLATMTDVEPGSYLALAKTTLYQLNPNSGSTYRGYVVCAVNGNPYPSNETTDDQGAVDISGPGPSSGTGFNGGPLTLQTTITRTSTGPVTLKCTKEDQSGTSAEVYAWETKLILIPIGSTDRSLVSG